MQCFCRIVGDKWYCRIEYWEKLLVKKKKEEEENHDKIKPKSHTCISGCFCL